VGVELDPLVLVSFPQLLLQVGEQRALAVDRCGRRCFACALDDAGDARFGHDLVSLEREHRNIPLVPLARPQEHGIDRGIDVHDHEAV
jgi:hypothetical protein